MKRILFIISVLLVLMSCEKQPLPEHNNGVYDPNAKITIRQAPVKDFVAGLTAAEIVEQAHRLKFKSHYLDNKYSEHPRKLTRAFSEVTKDFNIPALLMWGTDILQPELQNMYNGNSEYGIFLLDFIEAWDVYVVNINNDTIAQIPDEVLRNARPLIWQAYVDSNYNEVYRLFDEAFTFIPISSND